MPTIHFENATGNFTYQEVEQPPTTEPPPVTDNWTPPDYLRTDTDKESTPDLPKPGYLTQFIDPVFHTHITRISGDPGSKIGDLGKEWGDVSRHHYNSDQAWNCNQTLIYLDNPGVFLDGETYQPEFMANGIPSGSDVRWHATDPALMLYAAGSKLGTWNPKTGFVSVIKDFGSEYSDAKFGPWEGSPTEDGDMVVISCSKRSEPIAFAYKISTDKRWPDINRGDYDNVRISPLGNYIIWGHSPDIVVVTDLEGKVITELPDDYISHFDTCVDDAGDEVIVGRNNGAGGGNSGAMTKYRLNDGKKTQICPGGWCSHTSTRSKTHKYAVSAPTDEGGNVPPPYRGEVHHERAGRLHDVEIGSYA